jgi:hypothetical protein
MIQLMNFWSRSWQPGKFGGYNRPVAVVDVP